MSEATLAPRVDLLLSRLDAWADAGTVRGLLKKVVVSVTGPVVILAGIAMLVLPGPGLVVMSVGLALLALEYPWARRTLALMGHTLARAKEATLPKEGSRGRRALGATVLIAIAAAGFLGTTAATAFLGTYTVL